MQSEEISSFFLTLLSKCSMNYFPENTLSKFSVKLPYTLHLSKDNWLVGMKRFACTSLEDKLYWPLNMRNEKNVIYFKQSNNDYKVSIMQILHVVPSFLQIIIENEQFFDTYTSTEMDRDEVDAPNMKYINITSRQGLMKIPINYVFTPRDLFNYYFSQIHPDERVNEIEWLKNELQAWQRVSMRVTNAFFSKFKDIIDSPKSINYVCVYSDIIQATITGDCTSKVMYMLPIQDEYSWNNRRNVLDINNVEYHRVSKNQISEINILIADETGEQINFTNDSFSTMILLHFKKDI